MKDDNSPLNEKHKAASISESQTETLLNVKTLPEKDEQILIDTSVIDEQWAELTQDWQAQPFEKTDISALLKQTKKRVIWSKSCFVLNVIATVSLILTFVYGVYLNEFGTPWNSYLGLGGAMSLIFVYYEMKIRKKVWDQISDSPAKAIENALVACESSIKYMILTKWSCLPFGILANWFVYSIGQNENKSILSAAIFINSFIAVMYIGAEILHRKRIKEHKSLEQQISNL